MTGIFVAGSVASLTQLPATQPVAPVSTLGSSEPAAQSPSAAVITGGKLHGMVKSGNIPLPGVTVTAQNTLTGKRFSTTTDITGTWVLSIPQNGRYVLRTQFAGFAPGSQEAVLNAASRDQTVSFDLVLASRAAQQQENEAANQKAIQSTVQQLTANGAQSLSLISALGTDTDSQAGPSGATGAALPSIAGNSDFGDDSVAISGQTGAVSPLAGLDPDRVRDAVETLRAQGVLPGGQAAVTSAEEKASSAEAAEWAAVSGEVEADAGTFAASTPASRMAPSSGWAATRSLTRNRLTLAASRSYNSRLPARTVSELRL
jgi:hypothetical protein